MARPDTLACAVRLGGEADHPVALTEAGAILSADADAHHMPSGDVEAIMEQALKASATFPVTLEQFADGQAKAMRELADVPAADLDLARVLIWKLSEKRPMLPCQYIVRRCASLNPN